MASLQAATTDEHPNSSRLPRVSASSNPIETLQSVTTYLTAQGVPSSTIIGDYAHAALYHQHSHVPFAAPTGVAAAFMNSLPPHAQNRTSLIHDHTKGVRSLSSQADLNCALVTFQPFPSDPRLLVIPLQYDSLVKISKLLGDGLADTFLAGTTAPAPATGAPLVHPGTTSGPPRRKSEKHRFKNMVISVSSPPKDLYTLLLLNSLPVVY